MQGCDPPMNAPRFRLLRPEGEARDARLSRTEATLQATARQQEAVAHLGQQALAGAPVRDLMDAAVGLAARVLEVEFGSVLEFRPESRTLVLRAGVGWGDGSPVIIPGDADSHAGYTLRAAGPVVVEELATDARFATAPLLASHGVVSSLSVLIHGKDRPFGILGTHSARRREFAIHDTHFLQAVANVLATAIDRAATEQALRHSEEHFRSLIENASDIVTIVGDNGVFRYASPSVERVLGYGPAELLERSAFELVHPEDIALVAEALARAIQRPNAPQLAEFRFRHRDGSWRVLEAVGQARVDGGGAAQLIVNARDVTQRRRQERALRESKERLRTVIAGAPLVLFAFDQHGIFTMVEGRGLDALGFRPAQLIGRSVYELYADLPQALADVRRALAGETFSSTVEGFGTVFEAWYSPVRGTVGGPVSGGSGGRLEAPRRQAHPGPALRAGGAAPRRPDRVLRDDRRGHHRAAGPGRAAAPVAEDGGDRPAHRGHRPRLQQPADDHPGERPAHREGAPHRARRRARRPARRHVGGVARPRDGAGAARLRPPLEPRPPVDGLERARGGSVRVAAAHPPRRRRGRDRRRRRPAGGPRGRACRRADPLQPRHQRARRHAERRSAAD